MVVVCTLWMFTSAKDSCHYVNGKVNKTHWCHHLSVENTACKNEIYLNISNFWICLSLLWSDMQVEERTGPFFLFLMHHKVHYEFSHGRITSFVEIYSLKRSVIKYLLLKWEPWKVLALKKTVNQMCFNICTNNCRDWSEIKPFWLPS